MADAFVVGGGSRDVDKDAAKLERLAEAGLRRVEHVGGSRRLTREERGLEEQEREPISELAEHVRSCLTRAEAHRRSAGIDEVFTASQAARDGRYDDDEAEHYPEGCDVFRNVTGVLCRAAVAWITDVYAEAQDRPWTLEPTPVPSLPAHIADELEADIAQMLAAGGFPYVPVPPEAIDHLRETAHMMAMNEARSGCDLMQRRIDDQLTEGGWREAWAKFLEHLVTFPVACMKGPTIERRRRLKWVENDLSVVDDPILCVDAVDPRNLFPSPDSTTPQDGEFIIERMRMTRSRLRACRDMASFSKDAIDLVLKQGDSTGNDDDTEDQDGDDKSYDESTSGGQPMTLTVYDFWGRITGRMFLDWLREERAADIAEDADDGEVETKWGPIDPFDEYDLNIWMCGDIVLRAVLNPHPLNLRPYHTASCYAKPESFWGQGVPEILGDVQRELNAAIRAKVRNLGFASGPVVEIDADRVLDEDKNVEPWRVFVTRSKGEDKVPAVRFTTAQSILADLMAVAAEAWQAAHDIAGIPPYSRGMNQGAAKTLGAFSMQWSGALKGIKQIIGAVDVGVIEPLIRGLWTYNMLFADDDAIRVDAQVKTRGAAGLIALEHRQARPIETINAIGPVLERAAPQALPTLAAEFMKQVGYDPAMFGLPGGVAEAEVARMSRPPQIDAAAPRIDGRSGAALSAMAGAQVPPAPPTG